MSDAIRRPEPSPDCNFCPRLHDFIASWRQREPSWFNAPVPPFLPVEGIASAKLLIIGLAPGVRGANRTGRPFTGDYAGDLLYSTLLKFGFATGQFEARPDDSLQLVDTAIVNAVRCVPPENKPTPEEIRTCRQFLTPMFDQPESLRVVVTLGSIAHQSTIRAYGLKIKDYPFKHGLPADVPGGPTIISSYHCSRYNTNTGVLTTPMFHDVFRLARSVIDSAG
ncbi:uracil-DNA glycosylase [Tianweitania populi]|uniref:Type-5 uracil-DNA glycosylase n=1 Tax=Tianweitania populi TaxID=1607949 RepID=A0A8J3DW95_9HYPH|nr:uracil-DNA glycosylase [Tianweitania populi]GHD06764.1 uracil-DNA glycosylase [Tianweitania populi]